MIIRLEDRNPSGLKPLFMANRPRLAGATGVKLLDARRLLVNSVVGQQIQLIEFDSVRGTHRVVSAVDTRVNGQPALTDLLDYDGREFIATSDCGQSSVSLYRLQGDELSYVKSIPLAPAYHSFCHGVRFLPQSDVICATLTSGKKVIFVSHDTGQVVYEFSTGDWHPQDVSFLDPTRMIVLFVHGSAGPVARPTYDSKVSVVEFDLVAKRHAILSEIAVPICHVDACCHVGQRVYVTNQMGDTVLVLRVDNGRLVSDRVLDGYDFPHGIDVLPSANLLAVTNYGCNSVSLDPIPPAGPPVLNRHARVLAVVTHFRCEQWLEQCLASLVAQTRLPDHIVVVDDGSESAPLDIVKKFPQVTLLAAPDNVGPNRLLQQVLCDADHDAILLQDADDWSTPDRLARLLAEAERTGAEIVSSSYDDVGADGHRQTVCHPANATAAYAADPAGHFCCFGAALVSRALFLRVGGLASGLRFSGDAEFFRRARHVAHLANIPETCYLRRRHPGSLTQRPDTGMKSSARKELDDALKARALANADAVAAGREPDLTPFRTAPPVTLRHLAGPPLPVAPRSGATFVIGMHRSGTSLTANLLRQCGLWLGDDNELHAATASNVDGHWEHIAVTELNESLLNELGGGWDHVPDFPSGWLDLVAAKRTRASSIHADLLRPTPWGWKDPRASVLMPFWLSFAPDARVVICVRNPLDVAHSLSRRGLMSCTLGLKLWRAYNERLLADVPRHQRLFVHFEHYFSQPLRTLRQLANFCALEPAEETLPRIVATARVDLRHVTFTSEDLGRFAVAPDIVTLYARLCEEAGHADVPTISPGAAPVARQFDLDAFTYELFVPQWTWFVQQHTPVGARVAVVSKGDDNLLAVPQREAKHFPCDEEGWYAGYHPADDDEALAQLARARAAGVQFLAVPRSSMWWLKHYPRFAAELHRLPAAAEDRYFGAIFQIAPE